MQPVKLRSNTDNDLLCEYASQTIHDVVDDALVRKFRVDHGFVLVTLWQRTVHQVTYQTPLRYPWSRFRRNRALFRFYGDGQRWLKAGPIDFGRVHRREDESVIARYSRIMDFMTFVTTEFDEHHWSIYWDRKS